MVYRATMESKTEGITWNSIKNCIGNWCQKWCCILFGVIYRENKQWAAICLHFCYLLYSKIEINHEIFGIKEWEADIINTTTSSGTSFSCFLMFKRLVCHIYILHALNVHLQLLETGILLTNTDLNSECKSHLDVCTCGEQVCSRLPSSSSWIAFFAKTSLLLLEHASVAP